MFCLLSCIYFCKKTKKLELHYDWTFCFSLGFIDLRNYLYFDLAFLYYYIIITVFFNHFLMQSNPLIRLKYSNTPSVWSFCPLEANNRKYSIVIRSFTHLFSAWYWTVSETPIMHIYSKTSFSLSVLYQCLHKCEHRVSYI